MTVGRSWLAEAGIHDSKISGDHLQFLRANGGLYVEDAGSRNGTWVDGDRVQKGERALLADGAVLRVGRTLLVYRASFAGEPSPAAPIGRMVGPWGLTEIRARLADLQKRAPRNVLIEGATGTGKELMAAALIHALGRSKKVFTSINVAAVPSGVFEGQLFGWIKGSYSGSADGSKGTFGSHDGGAVILDEIGELPLELQPKLLRVLENREIQPVGASRPAPIDVIVIASTNRPLEEAVERGAFRRDLHARFTERFKLPRLAERREDVLAILEALLKRHDFTLDASRTEVEGIERLLLDDLAANARDLERVAAAIVAAGQLTFALMMRELPSVPRDGKLTREDAERMLKECGNNEREVERRFNVTRGKLRRALGKVSKSG